MHGREAKLHHTVRYAHSEIGWIGIKMRSWNTNLTFADEPSLLAQEEMKKKYYQDDSLCEVASVIENKKLCHLEFSKNSECRIPRMIDQQFQADQNNERQRGATLLIQ